jgi:hypothetical protein
MIFGRRIRLRSPILSSRFLAFLLSGAVAAFAAAGAHAADGRRDLAALLQSPGKFRIGIVGDSIAGDLARGMQKLLRAGDNVELLTFTKPATGLMRDDVYDWEAALEGFLRKRRLDAIAVVIGGNDRQSIWVGGKRLSLGSAAWLAEYERRVARFMTVLAAEKASVYWVGLPAVRSDQMSRDYRMLNRIYQAQAKKRGFTYLSAWDAFADAKGRYTAFGPGLDGVRRVLRQSDGKHFTVHGELRLAHLVARAISRDLASAKPAH